MTPAVFRIVLLVSCAHAMVHVYEQSLPSAEQLNAGEFAVGTETTGSLGTVWRIPFGVGAVAGGWMADRWGSKRLLMVYLVGCTLACGFVWWAPDLRLLFIGMFLMGTFASIYHPAGLALVSHVTTPANRARALGWH